MTPLHSPFRRYGVRFEFYCFKISIMGLVIWPSFMPLGKSTYGSWNMVQSPKSIQTSLMTCRQRLPKPHKLLNFMISVILRLSEKSFVLFISGFHVTQVSLIITQVKNKIAYHLINLACVAGRREGRGRVAPCAGFFSLPPPSTPATQANKLSQEIEIS